MFSKEAAQQCTSNLKVRATKTHTAVLRLFSTTGCVDSEWCSSESITYNEEYRFADVTSNSSLAYSDCKITELKILRGMRKMNSRTEALDFRKADFNLL